MEITHLILLIPAVLHVHVVHTKGSCTMEDISCEFFLEVNSWKTMIHVTHKKVLISDTNNTLHFAGTNETVPEEEVVLADGYAEGRAIHTVNGISPGPTLVMYMHQNITIHVTNRLTSEAFTMHWHGQEVRGTPWMDGAGYITQCPILPGQTFTYNFVVHLKGTYMYHTHSAALMNMGATGAFIVKEKKLEDIEEHILIVQDYNNQDTNIDIVLAGQIGIVELGGSVFTGYPLIDGTMSNPTKITSSLINGKGRIYENDVPVTKTPFTIFHVKKGSRYRFRSINTAIALQYILSIDNHSLDVVATDGHDMRSTVVDKFTFHSGERFDFILDANQEIGNYWIRLQTMVKGNRFPAYAILQYDGAADIEPTSSPKTCSVTNSCSLLGCATPTFLNHTCIRIDELKTDGTDPTPSANTNNFKEFFLNFGLALSPSGIKGVVNGVSYSHPTVSAMTQPREIENICTEDDECGVEKYCNCIKSITVELGDVVQLNILNMGFLSIIHHSIHTHGYSFHILKTGVRLSNEQLENLGNNPDIDCGGITTRALSLCNNASWTDPSWTGGNLPDVDLSRAPRKDTVNVPAGGYAVVRFVADNPGLWFLHCHMGLHVNLGMGLLLNDSFAHIPPPPPGFPVCRSFPRPVWLEDKGKHESTTPLTTSPDSISVETKDEGFEPDVFWGMFGAMLFVILVQFIVMVMCIRNANKTKYNL